MPSDLFYSHTPAGWALRDDHLTARHILRLRIVEVGSGSHDEAMPFAVRTLVTLELFAPCAI